LFADGEGVRFFSFLFKTRKPFPDRGPKMAAFPLFLPLLDGHPSFLLFFFALWCTKQTPPFAGGGKPEDDTSFFSPAGPRCLPPFFCEQDEASFSLSDGRSFECPQPLFFSFLPAWTVSICFYGTLGVPLSRATETSRPCALHCRKVSAPFLSSGNGGWSGTCVPSPVSLPAGNQVSLPPLLFSSLFTYNVTLKPFLSGRAILVGLDPQNLEFFFFVFLVLGIRVQGRPFIGS